MYRSITKRLSRTIILSALVAILLVSIPGLLLFRAKIQGEALSYEERIMEEFMNQVENKIGVLNQEANRILNDSEFRKLYIAWLDGDLTASNQLSLTLNRMVNASYSNGIHSIVVKSGDGKLINSISRIYSEDYSVDEDYLARYKYYLSAPSFSEEQGSIRDEIHYVTPISATNASTGYLFLNIDLAAFESVFISASDISDRYFWLGYDNNVIYPSTVNYEPTRFQKILSLCETRNLYNKDSFLEDNIYTLIRFSSQGGIKLVSDVSKKTLFYPYRWIFLYYIISLLVIVAIILIFSLPVLLKRLSPASRLTDHMMKTSRESSIRPFPPLHTGDEVERLADAFNTMAASINEKNELAVQYEKSQAKMRFSLLASQINPHFIYNTLNILTYLARQKRNEEVISVNQALIQILKDMLRINEKEAFDTVDHEINIVNQYILIQKYRYGSSFDVEYQADETARAQLIPKNMLEPLVENALFHGLVPVFDDNSDFWGRILVTVSCDETSVRIRISDNGIGMDEEQLETVRKRIDGRIETERGKHIALKNVYGRILHLYGTKEGEERLSIQSTPGEGTTVVLVLDRTGEP